MRKQTGALSTRARRLLIGVLGLIAILCLVKLVQIGYGYRRAAQLSGQAQQEFLTPPTSPSAAQAADSQAPDVAPPASPPEVDFAALQQTNADAVAWLWIADSTISYPVLQGEDNQRYLTTAYNGAHSVGGSIFMDYRNAHDFSDHNTILYGHNMKDRSMFGALKKYRDQDYAQTHQTIYLLTPQETRRYQVFAVYDVTVPDACYTRNFDSVAAQEAELSRAVRRSSFSADALPDTARPYITLSTCTAGEQNRLVLQAYAADD